MSFKYKVILGFLIIQLTALAALGLGGLQLVDQLATQSLVDKTMAVGKFLQPVGIVAINKNDMRLFERTAKLVLLSEEVEGLTLMDASGSVLVDLKQKTSTTDTGFIYRKNLMKNQQVLGQLHVKLTEATVIAIIAQRQSFVVLVVAGLATFFIIVGISIVVFILKRHEVNIESDNNEEIGYDADESEVVDAEHGPLVNSVAQSPSVDSVVESSVSDDLSRMSDSMSVYLELVKNSPYPMLTTNVKGEIIEFNGAAENLFGFEKSAVEGKNITVTLLQGQNVGQYKSYFASLNNDENVVTSEYLECQFCTAKDQLVESSVYMISFLSPLGTQVAMYVRDISQQKATENRLNYLAFNDELTDLPNLSLLSDHIRKATFDADKNFRQIVILKLGLDRFKHVNESLGHRFGDYLIRSIAGRLKTTARRGDMVSRINGDQFVVALVDVDYDKSIDVLVEKYLSCFNEAFNIESNTIHVTVSIGATIYPGDEKSVDGLLRNAESAMFRAKEKGGNNYQFFSQEMRKISQDRLYLENELRKALELDQFELHYQPQVNLNTGKIIGVEALIRWNHPEMGQVPPLRFIPLAEETGLIIAIGEWVLRQACKANKQLMNERGESLILAVNLSPRQFRDNDLVRTIATILHDLEYPPEFLELEITESLLMENLDDVAEILKVLSDQGIRISMDDFGTGYSSLSYLKRFPISTLKVDRSFVQDIEGNPDNASIVTATIQMAHSLNIDIVAEGVETEAQLKFLANKQCDKIQGFFFSRPLDTDQLIELLAEKRKIEMNESDMRLISGFK